MAKSAWRHGIPLESTAQERLRALIREQGGERAVAKMMDTAPISILRAAAGAGLRRSTAYWIVTRLAGLSPEC